MNEEKFDVIVIGGGPAGIVSAVTARKNYPAKKILVVKSVEKGVVPCGIPYMYKSLAKPEENALDNAPLEKNSISVLADEVINIVRKDKKISTKGGKILCYEKLILALGSNPILPPIKGIDKNGVYPINKNMEYLKELKQRIGKAKNVLIIGGGFIGIEFADELSGIKGLNIHLAEFLPGLLMNSFDSEFGKLVEEKLLNKNVNLLLGKKVMEIIGKEKVSEVRLSDGTSIAPDVVSLVLVLLQIQNWLKSLAWI